MPETAKRLAGPANLALSATTLYTVPAATTTIIRSVLLANTTAAALTVNLSIGTDATGTRLLSGFRVEPNDTVVLDGFDAVLATTEIVQAFASATGLTLTVSGIEIT